MVAVPRSSMYSYLMTRLTAADMVKKKKKKKKKERTKERKNERKKERKKEKTKERKKERRKKRKFPKEQMCQLKFLSEFFALG